MPYNETESLKDQVGVLVGLFASEESITKLSQVQLVQMGPKVIPYLLSVLEDMSQRRKKMANDIKKLENEDRKREEEKNKNGWYHNEYRPSREFDREKREVERESLYNEDIVVATLGTLSYFSDESLTHAFDEWIPLYTATKGLIRIGTKKSFELALPSVHELYKIGTEKGGHFGEDPDSHFNDDIQRYFHKMGTQLESNYNIPYPKQYEEFKLKVVKEILSYVPLDILKELIMNFPKVKIHEKYFLSDLMEKIGYEKFGDNVVSWFVNGEFETKVVLANGFMECKKLVTDEQVKKAFSMVLDGLELKKDYDWLTEEIPEKIDEFLVNVTDTKGKVEMYFKILAAKEKYVEENDTDDLYTSGGFGKSDTWDDLSIVNHILLKLQEHREEAIKILSKYLTNKDKKLVRWSTQLLGKLTEEAD